MADESRLSVSEAVDEPCERVGEVPESWLVGTAHLDEFVLVREDVGFGEEEDAWMRGAPMLSVGVDGLDGGPGVGVAFQDVGDSIVGVAVHGWGLSFIIDIGSAGRVPTGHGVETSQRAPQAGPSARFGQTSGRWRIGGEIL